MRTEKELQDKIAEVQEDFFNDLNNNHSLRNVRIIVNTLKWVLGHQWSGLPRHDTGNRYRSGHRRKLLKKTGENDE